MKLTLANIAPWFCSFRLWRFINHLLTYLLIIIGDPISDRLADYCNDPVGRFR